MWVDAGRFRYAVLIALAVALDGCASKGEVKEPVLPAKLDEVARQAAAAYAEGRWAESERLYRNMAERVPREVEPWFRLGNIFGRTNRPELAVAAYRETVIRDPAHAKAWHNMGVIQLRQTANSFKEMRLHVDPEDPLYENGKATLDGINALLRGGAADD